MAARAAEDTLTGPLAAAGERADASALVCEDRERTTAHSFEELLVRSETALGAEAGPEPTGRFRREPATAERHYAGVE